MKIIGIRPSSFSAREDESKQVSGKNIYLTYPLEKGEGHGSERIFVTDAKLNQWPYPAFRFDPAAAAGRPGAGAFPGNGPAADYHGDILLDCPPGEKNVTHSDVAAACS